MGKAQKELERQCQHLHDEQQRLQTQLRHRDEELAQAKGRKDEAAQKDSELARTLASQLEEAASLHSKKMAELQDEFQRRSKELSPARRVHFGDEAPSGSPDWRVPDDEGTNSHSPRSPGGALAPPPPEPDALEVEADSGVGWRVLHDREEQRAAFAKKELQCVQAEMSELKAATSSEMEAAADARQELLERQRAVDKGNDAKLAELKETERQSESIQQAQDLLDREGKTLQRHLSQAMYDVGKKDREQQLKEAELHEVRQNISSIQEEMDEVNRQLQAQCGRVQRVESSLRLSRDVGSKVQSMREMLKESHSALGQLCALVEQERAQKAECSQGLRQQQMRTELLLQLLSHFKSRTADLAPHVLLQQASDRMGMPASEPAVTGSHSAVPPLANLQ